MQAQGGMQVLNTPSSQNPRKTPRWLQGSCRKLGDVLEVELVLERGKKLDRPTKPDV